MDFQNGLSRRSFLAAALGAALLPAGHASTRRISVTMSPSCGCCGEWLKHLRANGFEVDVHRVDDVTTAKRKHGVPQELWSCHTGLIGGYVIEGHVPAQDIVKLLRERPRVNGLAVPGMPVGAPGMEQGTPEPYATIAFGRDGGRVFAKH